MPHIIEDRVQETTTTTGTGALALLGAPANFKTFASRMSVGDTCWYAIVDTTNNAWETGIGTYSAANTLTRTTVVHSSNADAVVTLAAGTKNVFISDGAGAPKQLQSMDTIAPPTSNSIVLFGRKIAGRMMTAQIGPSGLGTALQPLMARNKIGYWNPQGNATTVPGVFGFTAPTVVGVATTRSVATTNGATRMRRLGYVSAATVGAIAEARVAVAQFSGGSGVDDGSGFFYLTRFVPSNAADVSGERFFIGLRNLTSAGTNLEPNTFTQTIGLAQLSTDSTQFYIVYGGSTAQTAIACGTALGSPISRSTAAFELAIFSPNSLVRTYYIQVTNIFTGETFTTTLSGTTVQVPAETTLLAHRAFKTNNATALAVGFDICSIYVETDT
jgi:hypothetical protein